jgi:hypothetical protein
MRGLDRDPRASRIGRQFKAIPRFLFEQLEDKRGRLRRRVLHEFWGRNWRTFMRSEDVLRISFEHLVPAEHAVHDTAKRIKVSRWSDQSDLTPNLFGRDPPYGPSTRMHGHLRRLGPIEP